MMGLLEAIEASGISTWVRESRSLFAYPMVLTLHTFGLAVIVGSSAVVDLRLLGFAAHIPLKPGARPSPYDTPANPPVSPYDR